MEANGGISFPVLKELQTRNYFPPVIPMKPDQRRLINIEEQTVEASISRFQESEAYLAHFTQQHNEAQMPVACPSRHVQMSSCSNLEAAQGPGTFGYLPRWGNDVQSMGSSIPPHDSSTFGQVDGSRFNWGQTYPRQKIGLNQDAVMQQQGPDDPLCQWNHMKFGDLLGLNISQLTVPESGMKPGDGCLSSRSLIVDLNSTCEESIYFDATTSWMGNQRTLDGWGTQQITHTLEKQQCNLPSHLYGNPYEANSLQSTVNGYKSTFEPATWDQNKFSSERAGLSAVQAVYEQSKDRENQVASTQVDPQELQNEGERSSGSDLLPGKIHTLIENHNPDKGSNDGINVNKTPPQKRQRKKHRPKVVVEDKPKRFVKPRTSKSINPLGSPKTKRKYVIKNKASPSSMTHIGSSEVPNPNVPNLVVKTCRRSLNFNMDGQVEDHNSLPKSSYNSYSAPQVDRSLCLVKPIPAPASWKAFVGYHDEIMGNNHAAAYPMEGCCTDVNEANSHSEHSKNSRTKSSCSYLGHKLKKEARNLAATHGAVYSPSYLFLGDGRINTMANILFPGIYKKKRTEKKRRLRNCCPSSSGLLKEKDATKIAVEKISQGGNLTASKYYYQTPAPHFAPAVNNLAEGLGASNGCSLPFVNMWPNILKLKKKRSKLPTCVRDLALLTRFPPQNLEISPCNQATLQNRRVNVTNNPQACMEALAAATYGPRPTKKRSKRRFVHSYQSNIKKAKLQQGVVLDGNHRHMGNATGSFLALPWRDMPIDTITFGNAKVDNIDDGLQLLEMTRESNYMACPKESAIVLYHANRPVDASFKQRQDALVLYQKDDSIVPFEGTFDPVKRRRERAKVDLDEETTRVWKLLLENIDNKGIDGTDEDKAKWWEEERRVFHGRVDSFIARMRLVQGDRRFSPWKGSVVDSVIGVFLTQNVSDHLSSSAFMSLAAQFPLKSKSKLSQHCEEGTNAPPEDAALGREELETWSAKIADEPVCDKSSMTIHDADHVLKRKDVNSREILGGNLSLGPQDIAHRSIHPDSCESSQSVLQELAERNNNYIKYTEIASTSEGARVMDDVTSSQNSVLLSQTSANSPSGLMVGRIGSCSECNSKYEDLITSRNHKFLCCSTSCLELLKMAQIPIQHEICKNRSIQALSSQETTDYVPKGRENGNQQRTGVQKEIHGSSLREPGITRDNRLPLSMDFQLQDANCIQMANEESRSSDNSTTKVGNCTIEHSDITSKSTVHSSPQMISENVDIPISRAVNVCSSYILEGDRMVTQSQRQVIEPQEIQRPTTHETESLKRVTTNFGPGRSPSEGQCIQAFQDRKTNSNNNMTDPLQDVTGSATEMRNADNTRQMKGKAGKGKKMAFDWDTLRKHAEMNGKRRKRAHQTMDSLDYEAVRYADVREIADTIKDRGMNNMLAERMKDFLNRLVTEHGSIDLEWLRDVPPDKAKDYLLSIRGLGLKSVECVRLLTLQHLAFPVDTNVGRIAVRLGWVPLQPLPESLQLHLLELYPVLESIQKYLWPRLCKLDQRTLYELHYHMITFGKVFCTKRQPNCNACPLRAECRHFASAFASARLALPGPEERRIVASNQCAVHHQDPQAAFRPFALPVPQADQHLISSQCGLAYQGPPVVFNPLVQGNQPTLTHTYSADQDSQVHISPLPLPLPLLGESLNATTSNSEPIVEVPESPEPEQTQLSGVDMEDMFYEDPNEIPTINLSMQQLSQTLESYVQSDMGLQQSEISKALITLTAEAASIPMPKLKNVSRLRTEHHVYELPDDHPLLRGLNKREPDDPCPYLLAIWSPGETADSTQPPERRCSSRELGQLCNDEACFHCNSQREANCQIVRATLLIPCRTAMRGSFPLNGTYFQVNEVFAEHDSSLNPIAVPRNWLWSLHRRTVYFGTSIPTIFRGLSTEGIQHCFWRGYVCVRGFDQKTRAPRPLMARLHFPASKMTRAKCNPKSEALA